MRVLLIGAELEENLSLRYLAAALREAGHEWEIAELAGAEDQPRVLAALDRLRPDLLGLSMTFQRRAHEFGALATAARAQGFTGHITCGGHFPTFAHREILARFGAIDSVVRHEGERTLTELCAALARGGGLAELGGVAGLTFRLADGAVVENPARPLEPELDALPFPARTGEPPLHLGVPAAFLVGSRGCYGSCAFCCIHAYHRDAGGPKYRARSVDNVADEIQELRTQRGARMLVFHDDDFFTRDAARDLARVTGLRDALRRRGVNDIALVVKARPDDCDPAVFRVLAEIGLLRVYVGIEAGSSQGLATLGRGVPLSENERALAFLAELGTYACYNMLLFDPETTLPSLRQSLDFIARHPEVPMNFCRTEIYVGTPIMRRLARQDRLIGDVFGWDYVISDPAAERAFRIFSRIFRDRNFRCDGLMNSTIGLGYHLHLLKQYYPRALTRTLVERTDAAIRRVNLDSVAHMRAIADFTATPGAQDPDADEEFTTQLYRRVLACTAALEDEVKTATAAIGDAVRGRHAPPPLWKAVAAATLVLSPLSCKHEVVYPQPDPPPPPTGGYYPVQDPLPPPTGTTGWPGADDDGRYALPPDPPPPPHDVLPPPQDPLPPPTYRNLPPTGDPPPPPPDPLPEPTQRSR